MSTTAQIAIGGNKIFELLDGGPLLCYRSNTDVQVIDNSADTCAIAVDAGSVYLLKTNGEIYNWTGAPLSWVRLDSNEQNISITASGGHLYLLHRDNGQIWQWTGSVRDGWFQISQNPENHGIVADGDNLFLLHGYSGQIWMRNVHDGNFVQIDGNPKNTLITASAGNLYLLQRDIGQLYKWNGTPQAGWSIMSNNPNNIAASAVGNRIYLLQNDGSYWVQEGPAGFVKKGYVDQLPSKFLPSAPFGPATIGNVPVLTSDTVLDLVDVYLECGIAMVSVIALVQPAILGTNSVGAAVAAFQAGKSCIKSIWEFDKKEKEAIKKALDQRQANPGNYSGPRLAPHDPPESKDLPPAAPSGEPRTVVEDIQGHEED